MLFSILNYLCSISTLSSSSLNENSNPTQLSRLNGNSRLTKLSTRTDAPPPISTACGDIISRANDDPENAEIFRASAVYECLISVPFNDAVATRFLQYYNTTIQFQSTLAYLKNPPVGYQQPAIDVEAALEEIQQNITARKYPNQYEFEATVQSLVYAMHDSHVTLDAGLLSAFTFGSPYDIMSVSVDGKQKPQIYIANDVIHSLAQGWTPSPIVSIDGIDVEEYLRRHAALNSRGMLEPHADWNQLMYNPVQNIVSAYNVFGWTTTFYPGDKLSFKFANQSSLDTYWIAFYHNPQNTGPLTTGGDFYNYFVLGFLPASYNATVTTSSNNSTGLGNNNFDVLTSWYNVSAAFPERADIFQPGLAVGDTGFLTGYFRRETSTAILSIPTFAEYDDGIGTFSNTTYAFIQAAKAAGMKRVIIDLQQNTGGLSLLAVDTFRQFFPDIEPYVGSRRRSHQLGNVLGETINGFWSSLTPSNPEYNYRDYYIGLAANEWVVTDRLNAATGQNFSSWSQYAGPVSLQGDQFSLIERYNFSSEIFDYAAFGGYIPPSRGADQASGPGKNPWEGNDIMLLTDGMCGSTCSLFVEMMKTQAGARTLAVGGLPTDGPMQAASGSRGAGAINAYELDRNFAFASSINSTAKALLPQVRDRGIYTYSMGVNLRSQVRPNEDVPLQFQYEAADCRIYYSLENAYNLTKLWDDAAAATWDDPSLCVTGSTGFAKSGNETVPRPPPQVTQQTWNFVNSHVSSNTSGEYLVYSGGLHDYAIDRDTDQFIVQQPGELCRDPVLLTCGNGEEIQVCRPPCEGQGTTCGAGLGWCDTQDDNVENKASTVYDDDGSFTVDKNLDSGSCSPSQNHANDFCSPVFS